MLRRTLLNSLIVPAAIVATSPGRTAPHQGSKFKLELEALARRHGKEVAETERLGAEGRADESVARLLQLIPESKRTAASCFWIGSLLYDLDPARSYDLHRQAYQLDASIREIAFEWGLEEHRAGHYAAAVELYLRSLPAKESDERFALLADCYIRLGQAEKASGAWTRADHPNHHSGIDGAIHWVYGKPSPSMRRTKLLASARGGDPSAWGHLIRLDTAWDTNWWNAEVNEAALKADLASAKAALDKMGYSELEALSRLFRTPSPTAEWLRDFQAGPGWILDGKPLPRNTLLASRLLEWNYRKQLMTAPELVDRFQDDLWKRARSGSKDAADALHILAGLSLEAGRSIKDIDRFGWEQLHDAKFALSLLAGKGKALASEDPDLRRALAEFPGNSRIALMAARAAYQEKKPMKQPLVALIQAEFMGLETDDNRYSYALKGYFGALAEALSAK